MSWWRRLAGGKRLEIELDAELRDHVERLTAEHVRLGMSELEARRRALLAFGGVEVVKEACRDARGTRWLDEFVDDVRYAIRLLRKHPSFTSVAVLSLALGIGANTAIFSLVDAVLLKTLPVRAPEELVLLSERTGSRETLSWALSHLREFRESETLAGLCAFRPRIDFSVASSNGTDWARGQLVSGDCFDVLGVRAVLGRTLTGDDERAAGAHPVAVISHGFWQRHFGGDPAIVGRTLDLQGRAFTIVGVTAPAFSGLETGHAIDVTVPLSVQSMVLRVRMMASPNVRWLRLVGRLRPGVSRGQAAADLERRRLQLAAGTRGGSDAGQSRLELLSGAQGLNDLRQQFSLPLRLLMAAVGLLLLIVCANLASLMLARARAREHEMSLRRALGASGGRIVRQLLTESLVLSMIGALAGLALAYWGSHAVVALLSRGRTAILLDLALDLRLLAFTLGVSVLAALVFGMWPALSAARTDLQPQLQSASRTLTVSARRRSAVLVTAQAALSVVLVIGALLFARSLMALHAFDVGFNRHQVLLFRVAPGAVGYDEGRAARLFQELYARLSSAPGVRSVTLLMDTPLGGTSYARAIAVPGRPSSHDEQVNFNFVGPRFFETMGIPMVSGRDFGIEDDARARPIAVISQSLASHYFPGRHAVGERFQAGQDHVEIVGVAKDVPYEGIRAGMERVVYRPYLQDFRAVAGPTFAVRADLLPAVLTDRVRGLLREMAPAVPLRSTTTLDEQFDGSIATERLLANISGFFGAMALLLVGMGVYGTLAYAVAQRTRELGIRLALGATRGRIAKLVLTGALTPVCVGFAGGLPLAFAATRLTRGTLFGVTALDPLTYVGGFGLLFAAALLATALPVRAAVRANPTVALRQE